MLNMRFLGISAKNPNPKNRKLTEALKAIRPGKGILNEGIVLSVTNNWSRPVLKNETDPATK